MNNGSLLEVKDVRQAFPRAGGAELLVLEGVNLALQEDEIVGLLGRSGSGKSTLLRLIAGLAAPTGGDITYRGSPVHGPARGIAMVFQSFALFPWLTVLENVQLGLDEFHYVAEPNADLNPGRTDVPGVFVAGTASGAKDIVDSILHAGAAVAQVAAHLEQVKTAEEVPA